MSLVVQKYGGSSLTSPEDIRRVAKRVVEERKKGHRVVVVVSAMGDTTDHLIQLAEQVCQKPPEREMDMLLSVGERISIALLAMAIHDWGYEAISFTGSQVGIITDTKHTEARILEIRATRLLKELEKGKIVVVAGFQGVSVNKEITTLGRGGSDTTAIALAAALKADRCEFMKDVDGVYVAEPRLVPKSRLNPELSYQEMLEMASMGAGVLKSESIEIANTHKIKIAVGSSASGKIGTIISDRSLESSRITGIVGQKELCYLNVKSENSLFINSMNKWLARNRIKTQAYAWYPDRLEIVFHCRYRDFVMGFLTSRNNKFGHIQHQLQNSIGMVAIVGTGLNFNSDLSLRIFSIFEKLGLQTKMLQVSPLKISWLLSENEVDTAIQRLYKELDYF